jgi:hypothetical protein
MKYNVIRVIAGLILLAAIVALGAFAYNAGIAQGAIAGSSAPAASAGAAVYPFHGYGAFWHPVPFFGLGCFGLLMPLVLVLLMLSAFRWVVGGPRWGWRHAYHRRWMWDDEGVPPMFAEWHRRIHGEPEPEGKK